MMNRYAGRILNFGSLVGNLCATAAGGFVFLHDFRMIAEGNEEFNSEASIFVSKYPPAKPEALRLLAPQRGLFATVESKSKCNSKNHGMRTAQAMRKATRKDILPELSNCYCHPGKALSITHKFSTDADAQLNINEAS
jgi:hypothetical protein